MSDPYASLTLSPDVLAKLSQSSYGMSIPVDLGNGLVAQANWTQQGGEGGSGPQLMGYSVYDPNNKGVGQPLGNYDLSGKYTNTSTFNPEGSWKDALVPALAAGAMYFGMPGLLGQGASAAGGSGAFLGEGMASGVPAWDAAATNAGLSLTAPAAASGLTGDLVDAGIKPIASLPAAASTTIPTTFSSVGSALGAGGLVSAAANALGVSPGWVQAGLGLLGAAAGSQGVKQTQTQSRDIPEWLKPYVTGQGGLLGSAQNLFQQQMGNQQGWNNMANVAQGLLSRPVAGNGFAQFQAMPRFGSK